MKHVRTSTALACWICCALTGAAQAAANVTLVRESERVTHVRINVGTPAFTVVNTPSGEFRRFARGEQGLGSVRGGAEARGLPELPVTGFPLALPLDFMGAPGITVTPEGPIRRASVRLYPVQPSETAFENEQLPAFEFDATRYLKGAAGPGEALSRKAIFKGDANVETLRFSPYGYDPATQMLTWYDSYLVQVQHAARPLFRDRPSGPTPGPSPPSTASTSCCRRPRCRC